MEEFANERGTTKPTKTWFFERGDGFVFACDEPEAWDLLNNRNAWMRRDFKMLGTSDGKTYFDIIRKAKTEIVELTTQRDTLLRDKEKYAQTEDRLRFQELKNDDDEMVIKVMEKLNEINTKLVELDEQIKNFNKITVDKAFNTELEKARGNMEQPRNFDIIVPNEADREKVLNNLKI